MLQYNFYKTMSKENITFRIDSDQKAALDAIAFNINEVTVQRQKVMQLS